MPSPVVDLPALESLRGRFPPPEIIDVRRGAALIAHPVVVAGAIVRDLHGIMDWGPRLDWWRPIVVYCAEGHERGAEAAATLRAQGFDARALQGGLAAYEAAGGRTLPRRPPTRWVTRARPKIDRIACPWLVRRFIDPDAQFHYVPRDEVRAFAAAHQATPFDVPDVEYTHVGASCSFDAFVARHALRDPALDRLATLVRAADTGAPHLAPQAEGLLAASQGLSHMFEDDHAMLRAGMLLYDALYAWCRSAGTTAEAHPAAPAGAIA